MYSAGVSSSLPKLLFIAAAIVAVLGHVCALPAHAHVAIDPPLVDEHDGTGGHDSEESLHAASCEVVVSTSSNIPSAVSMLAERPRDGCVALYRERLVSVTHRPPVDSPPLFLLHASLLI